MVAAYCGLVQKLTRRSLKPQNWGRYPDPLPARKRKIVYGVSLMIVSELKKILECFDDDKPILFEYTPRPHQYVVEPILGVRAEPSGAIIIGEKNFS